MSLKTVVIVNSITNLTDARYCAGMGVEMLGFDLSQTSPNFINPELFRVITEWVSGVKKVGEIPIADAADLEEFLTNYHIDYLQTETSSDWRALKAVGIPLICKIAWYPQFTEASFTYQYAELTPYVDLFLLQSDEQTISKTSWQEIKQIAAKFPVVLGFGITAQNIDSLLAEAHLKGIALKGSHEIRPGFKDFDELAEILEAIEVED